MRAVRAAQQPRLARRRTRAGRRARTARPASPRRRSGRATRPGMRRRCRRRRSPRASPAERYRLRGRPTPRYGRPRVGMAPRGPQRRTCHDLAVKFVVAAIALLLGATAPAQAAETFGRSVLDRPLTLTRAGDPEAPVRVLVVGSIHGNETAGHAVVARLRELEPPPGVQLWIVRTVNPDGALIGTRQNARGVDLNRNFPFRWRGGGRAFDTYFPGRAAGERARDAGDAAAGRGDRPDADALLPPAHAARVARAHTRATPRSAPTAAASGSRRAGCPSTAARSRAGRTTAIPRRRPSSSSCPRARSRRVPPGGTRGRCSAWPSGSAPSGRSAAAKPDVEWDRIPFGEARRAQMRAYSRRHYGSPVARLRDPKVIVEHYTATHVVLLDVEHVRGERA